MSQLSDIVYIKMMYAARFAMRPHIKNAFLPYWSDSEGRKSSVETQPAKKLVPIIPIFMPGTQVRLSFSTQLCNENGESQSTRYSIVSRLEQKSLGSQVKELSLPIWLQRY
jgi:hypothetical protein